MGALGELLLKGIETIRDAAKKCAFGFAAGCRIDRKGLRGKLDSLVYISGRC
jgi:hypothetical protein